MRKLLFLLFLAAPAWAEMPPNSDQFVATAVEEYGLSADDVRAILEQAEYQQSIVDAISRPAEGKPWYEYRKIFLGQKRIDDGVTFWQNNRELIAAASEKFGVDESIIVAIIGVETFYGRITGNYRTIDALVTLGFYYPQNLKSDRSAFFSKELLQFLKLASEEGLPATEITGSYAGAMGMGQFMPSSYLEYAVDFDEDGHRDLWSSTDDAVGSVANYLKRHKWQLNQPIAVRMKVSENADFSALEGSYKPSLTVAEWKEKGFTPLAEVAGDTPAALLKLKEPDRNGYWMVFNNFYVITRYNRSPRYAMAVYDLSQAIQSKMGDSPDQGTTDP